MRTLILSALALAIATPAAAAQVDDATALAMAKPRELIVSPDISAARRGALLKPVDAFYGFWINGSSKLLAAALSPKSWQLATRYISQSSSSRSVAGWPVSLCGWQRSAGDGAYRPPEKPPIPGVLVANEYVSEDWFMAMPSSASAIGRSPKAALDRHCALSRCHQISVPSARVRTSSTSTPRYLTVFSILVWPSSI